MTSPLEQALDELYATPLEQFMETRDGLAKKLKAAGDKDGAAEVKKQHKPTQVAHALNLLSREARGELEALFEAGRALASGKDFKASLERQRAALEAVKKKASGPDVPAIIAVVQGALVDPTLAEAVRAGRFAKLPEVPVGFFGAAPEGAPPVVLPPKKPEPPPPPPPPPPPLAVVPVPAVAPKKPEPPQPPIAPKAPPTLTVVPPRQSAPSPASKRDPAVEKELKAAEKEAAALADEVAELERELIDTKRRAHEAAERAAKLKKRLDG